MKKKINLESIMIGMVFVIFCCFFLSEIIYKCNKANLSAIKYCIVFFLFFIAVGVVVFFLKKKATDDEKIPKLFLLVASIFGIFYIGAAPTLTGSDDHIHLDRIYELSEGNMITDNIEGNIGSELPKSLKTMMEKGEGYEYTIRYKHIGHMKKVKEQKQNRELFSNEYNGAALYIPVQYLPHVIGFKLGSILNISLYYKIIFSRVFNLIFYLLLGYFALKYTPKNKIFYLLILLSPNMLQLATTLSTDAFTNGIVLLFIAMIMNKKIKKEKISIKYGLVLSVLSLFISVCKIVYFPILLLLFFLDNKNFKDKKTKYIYIITTILVSIIIAAIWMGITGNILSIAYSNSNLQKSYILHHPFQYCLVVFRTYISGIVRFLEELFVGDLMYNAQLSIPSIISLGYLFFVVISLFLEHRKNTLNNIERITIGGICLAVLALISTAIYIQATAQYVGIANRTISGIQGRYFIPIVLLLPFVIDPWKKKLNIANDRLIYYNYYINMVVLFYIFVQFV